MLETIKGRDDLSEKVQQLVNKCVQQSTSMDQSGIITKGQITTFSKRVIEVLRSFVDFEQNYSSMRFLDPA